MFYLYACKSIVEHLSLPTVKISCCKIKRYLDAERSPVDEDSRYAFGDTQCQYLQAFWDR